MHKLPFTQRPPSPCERREALLKPRGGLYNLPPALCLTDARKHGWIHEGKNISASLRVFPIRVEQNKGRRLGRNSASRAQPALTPANGERQRHQKPRPKPAGVRGCYALLLVEAQDHRIGSWNSPRIFQKGDILFQWKSVLIRRISVIRGELKCTLCNKSHQMGGKFITCSSPSCWTQYYLC